MSLLDDGTREIRSQYVWGFPRLMAVLRHARDELGEGSGVRFQETVRRLARQIRGTASSIGLEELGNIASAIETAESLALLSRIDDLIEALQTVYSDEGPQNICILLVSSDVAVVSLSRAIANRLGHQLVQVSQGGHAQNLRTSERWSAIVMDLDLPGEDSLALVGEFCRDRAQQELPIIVLTRRGDLMARSECWAYGIEHVIEKPVDPDHLESIILLSLERQHSLVERAYIDELTGLNNRRGFRVMFRQAHAQSRRYGTPLSLAMLDLDRFSSFNNKYGHKLGDRVLVRFAESLQRELRQSDLIGRWGGEEFVVAYPGTPVTGALVALRKVASDMRASRVDDSCSDSVTFSGGLVEVRSDDALDDVLGRADDLLYAAKRQGRDRVLHVIPSDLVDKPAILVAEDDPTMAALLRHDLDGQYDVTQVSDGTDAVEAAAKRTFDLVLLDYEMPGMSGLDVLRHLRAQTAYKACPILMLTAAGADPLIEEAFQSGVDDYVTKPYSRRALLARIERHIGRQLD